MGTENQEGRPVFSSELQPDHRTLGTVLVDGILHSVVSTSESPEGGLYVQIKTWDGYQWLNPGEYV